MNRLKLSELVKLYRAVEKHLTDIAQHAPAARKFGDFSDAATYFTEHLGTSISPANLKGLGHDLPIKELLKDPTKTSPLGAVWNRIRELEQRMDAWEKRNGN